MLLQHLLNMECISLIFSVVIDCGQQEASPKCLVRVGLPQAKSWMSEAPCVIWGKGLGHVGGMCGVGGGRWGTFHVCYQVSPVGSLR